MRLLTITCLLLSGCCCPPRHGDRDAKVAHIAKFAVEWEAKEVTWDGRDGRLGMKAISSIEKRW